MLIHWILFSGTLEYNKHIIVFYCISQLECYIRIINNVFVRLDYEMSADRAVYLCIYTELYSNCDRSRR